MTAVAGEHVPLARHRLAQRLRAGVLGPRGGGTTRRRASDAFRLGFAIVVVAVSIPVMRANSAAELAIVRALNPPPAAISWLVTTVFWLGSVGVVALLALVGPLVPRLTAVRHTAVAAVLTWVVCILLGVLLGPAAGRPPHSALAGLNTGYPVTVLAVTVAMAATALPYLSRPLHRLVWFLIAVAVLTGVSGGQALPVNAISSIALGWGVAAALHLVVGSPLGLPSAAEVAEWISDLNVAVADVTRVPRQVWGVEQFTGRGTAGEKIELSVYGRDASDARVLAKLWRFCVYRDSGPTLILDRLQQVEHEAYLTFMAGRARVLVPEVLAAGRFGPSKDAALVTSVPAGPALAQAGADLADGTLDEILRTVLRLREAGLAHGTLGGDTIIVADQGICIRGFRSASASAPASRLDSDLAAGLAAMAVQAGAERTAAAAARVLDADAIRGALIHLQRSALDPLTVAAVAQHKDLLPRLRQAMASGAGIEVPQIAEVKRVSWVNLLFGLGSLIGIWALIVVLSGAGSAFEAIKGASWGWVALAFVFAQLPPLCSAWALLGAVTGELPYGRCAALEVSNAFSALAGGNVAVFAVRVRFFQRQGYDAATAVSSGAIVSTTEWVVKALLFIIAIPFAIGTFHGLSTSGGAEQTAAWIILVVIIAAGIAAALITLVPRLRRLRRLATSRVRPHLVTIWGNVKAIATEPHKLVYIVAGSTLAQLAIILSLGASLHAVGEHASIATLVCVNTLAAVIGGVIPVPNGAGVVEAGLIAGLTSAGIPENQAVAAVLIQRVFTAYLPPVWGWFTLAWMRRREYI
jgi:glycosyltransferase 2 family protein